MDSVFKVLIECRYSGTMKVAFWCLLVASLKVVGASLVVSRDPEWRGADGQERQSQQAGFNGSISAYVAPGDTTCSGTPGYTWTFSATDLSTNLCITYLQNNLPWAIYSIDVAPSQSQRYIVQLYADTNCSLPLGPPVNTTSSQLCIENEQTGWGWFGAFEIVSLVPLPFRTSLTFRNPQNQSLPDQQSQGYRHRRHRRARA
jgi:hypothetical protein